MSSVVRTVTGDRDDPQRDGTGNRGEVPHPHDHHLIDEEPTMMDGALSSTSFTKRMTMLSLESRPYSARYVPASTPIGAPMKMPRIVITALPYNALRRPHRAAGRRRVLREQRERYAAQAVAQQRPENGAEKKEADERRRAGQAERDGARDLASLDSGHHTEDSALRLSRHQHQPRGGDDDKVMTNSSTPSAISEDV